MKKYFPYVCVGLVLLPPPHAAAAQKQAAQRRVVVHKHMHAKSSTAGDYATAVFSLLGAAGGIWYLMRSRSARVDKIEQDTTQILQRQGVLEQGQVRLESGQQEMSARLQLIDEHVGVVDAGVQKANGTLADHTKKLELIEAEAKSMLALLAQIRATQSDHSTTLSKLEEQLRAVASQDELQGVKQMLTEHCAAFKKFTEQGQVSKADLEQFAASLESRVSQQIKTTLQSA